ncbi:hypothetical protein [Micromonospora tulbaghiae]|uniref:hypothetical protein n=1 Tax=Micromonospora tulbaghiae TaxID=479978 RepID=UPI0013C4FF5C|nr:hypothetical protein [Micromonospora tulbaghiae]
MEHAALLVGDTVELEGQQLGSDGTPLGRVWLTVDVHALKGAVVGQVTLPFAR